MIKKPKLISSIRAKLVSAVAMLLVAVIMVVSSTYAWFTLSTAPEVTGIQTAIGANGSLEMALLPSSGKVGDINSEVGDSTKAPKDKNITWGNLVDLSDKTTYGMDKITLLPSALNRLEGNLLGASLLKTPVYGSDGRIKELVANTVFGNFDGKEFAPGDDFGFRAVGVASGLTSRQAAYSNAKSAAATAVSQAKTTATASLKYNGAALANIAIQHAADASSTHTVDDVKRLLAIVNDLLGYTMDDGTYVTGSLEYIEIAYMQYLLAYAASAAAGEVEAWGTIEEAINADNATVKTVLNSLPAEVTAPDGFSGPVDALYETIATVEEAKAELDALTEDTEITWAELSVPLNKLANVDSMEVNGIPAKEIKEKMSELVSSVGNGLTVAIASEGGVYADIADHCGDYFASIKIEKVEYGGMVLNNMDARMETKTNQNPTHLATIGAGVVTAGMYQGATDEVKPLTEFYGYVIDMAFRTNAAESNLLLQTEGIDRIYGEEGNLEETMGHGSSMTFKSTAPSFSDEKVMALMKCIRIVFFDTDTLNVLCEARLDVDNAELSADGVTAKMYICDIKKELDPEAQDDNGNLYKKGSEDELAYLFVDGVYYVAEKGENDEYTQGDETDLTTILNSGNVATTEEPIFLDGSEGTPAPVIKALTQNEATAVSALVYLDGNELTNDDVAYEAATSVTGTANFQFASSATLVPMDYEGLKGSASSDATP